jgi:anthranilate phosphoribosyltransferase
MFAPHHNPAMGLVAKIRKELGVKTIFNVLGPLLNPANCAYQLIGVYDWNLLNPVGLMLESAGRKRAWVVHCDGVDELMTTGMNTCCQVDGGNVGIFNVSPEGLGLQAVEIADIKGGDAAFNAAAIQDLVAGKPSPYRDVVVLNAAAALVIARKAQSIKPKHAFLPDPEEDLKIGVALAIEALDRGKVRKTLENFVAFTREI